MPTEAEKLEQQQERRRRIGEAILWALSFLTAYATVDAPALALARQTWRRLAPEAGRPLWDANVAPTQANPQALGDLDARYRWKPEIARYVHNAGKNKGRSVAPKQVQQQVATFNEAAAGEARVLSSRMTSGRITIGEWQMQAAQLVKNVHVASYVIGRGGANALLTADFDTMRSMLTYQARKLQDFAVQVAATPTQVAGAIAELKPLTIVTNAQAEQRLALYAAAANASFGEGDKSAWQAIAGTGVAVEESNVLGEADHCKPHKDRPDLPTCPSLTALGWVSFRSLPAVGRRVCGVNCKCRIARRRKQD